jgi:hypothetical protein
MQDEVEGQGGCSYCPEQKVKGVVSARVKALKVYRVAADNRQQFDRHQPVCITPLLTIKDLLLDWNLSF